MKLNTALKIIRTLPMTEKSALSIAEILTQWNGDVHHAPAETRSLQRYFKELTHHDHPIIQKIEVNKVPKYYLNLNHVAQWFLNDIVAFNLLTSKPAITNLLPEDSALNIKDWYKVALELNNNQPALKKLRTCIRIVSDGLGRLPATIAPTILHTVLEGIMNHKQLTLDYVNSKGQASSKTISVQGLVAKDGTLYIISTTGLSDNPRHLALHRVKRVEVSHLAHQEQTRFDLEAYIEQTQQLSHVLDHQPAFELKLRVKAHAIYHFKERPLAHHQTIELANPSHNESDYLVTAQIPNTILLIPFLLSMGHAIEVLAPDFVRSQMREQTEKMLAHYQAS